MEWAFTAKPSLVRNDMRNKPIAASSTAWETVRAMLLRGIVRGACASLHHQQKTKPIHYA